MEMFGSYPCCIYGDWNTSNSENLFSSPFSFSQNTQLPKGEETL